MLACEFGELNIVRELLEAHVDPNAVDMVCLRQEIFVLSCKIS